MGLLRLPTYIANGTSLSTPSGPLPRTTLLPAVALVSSSDAEPNSIVTAVHGFVTGDRVLIADHTVHTAANGTWTITVVDPITFTLDGSVASGQGAGGATGTATLVRSALTYPSLASWLVGVEMPAAWTAAALTFQGLIDSSITTYVNLYGITTTAPSAAATELSATGPVATGATLIALPPALFQTTRAVKIRSGTAAAAVNQGAHRILYTLWRDDIRP